MHTHLTWRVYSTTKVKADRLYVCGILKLLVLTPVDFRNAPSAGKTQLLNSYLGLENITLAFRFFSEANYREAK